MAKSKSERLQSLSKLSPRQLVQLATLMDGYKRAKLAEVRKDVKAALRASLKAA